MSEFQSILDIFIESVNHIHRGLKKNERLERINKAQQQADQLRQVGVKSLDDLFDLLRDTQADSQLRLVACEVLTYLVWMNSPQYRRLKVPKLVDKRRALHPLLDTLRSDNPALRSRSASTLGLLGNKGAVVPLLKVAIEDSESAVRMEAIMALGALDDKRTVAPLLDLVQNRQAEHWDRQMAIVALGQLRDERAAPPLIALMLDKSEDERLRGEAAERLSYLGKEELIQPYLTALRDNSAEVRFWAVFGLTCISQYCDISPALPDLDRLVAYDTAVPLRYWAVGREAILALESIWYKHRLPTSDNFATCLISPTSEYFDFQQKTTILQDSTLEYGPLDQPISLQLDPAWLAEQIRANWPAARINVREPRPEALLLDWEIDMAEELLMGGLHRDKYCVILTGKDDDVEQFAAWYRRIIPAQHKLLLYGWASHGEKIKGAGA